jgi:Domain of unknown function (DUF4303)
MNKAVELINSIKEEIIKTDLEILIKKGLVECWGQLQDQSIDEEIYTAGIYSGNMGFGYLTFTSNTIQGLNERIVKYENDEDYKDKSTEELGLSLKWNAADWKYHDTIFSDYLENASEILTGITERMYDLEECDPELDDLDDDQIEEVYTIGRSVFEVAPNYMYYDKQEHIYEPGYNLIYTCIHNAINIFKSEIDINDNIVCGMFCGDASYDFMLKNCLPTNKKETIKSIINDLRKLGDIQGMNYLDVDYSSLDN